MYYPSDAQELDIIGTKTVRVTSIHSGNTFSAVFTFHDDSFYKFKVKLDRVITSTKNDLFKLITGSSSIIDFQTHPTYIDIECTGMDDSGCIVGNVLFF